MFSLHSCFLPCTRIQGCIPHAGTCTAYLALSLCFTQAARAQVSESPATSAGQPPGQYAFLPTLIHRCFGLLTVSSLTCIHTQAARAQVSELQAALAAAKAGAGEAAQAHEAAQAEWGAKLAAVERERDVQVQVGAWVQILSCWVAATPQQDKIS
jgi:hypothetical protein